MESKKIGVIYAPTAKNSIRKIAAYIEDKGYPETAEKFINKLYNFGNSLADYHFAYPVCKQPQFAKRNMHCAIFNENYIFVYKLVETQLIIYNIIHCKTNPGFHAV